MSLSPTPFHCQMWKNNLHTLISTSSHSFTILNQLSILVPVSQGFFQAASSQNPLPWAFFFLCSNLQWSVFSPFGSWLPIMVLLLLFLASLLLTLKWNRFSCSFSHFLVFSQISPLFSFTSIQIASKISIFSSCLSWFPDSSSTHRFYIHLCRSDGIPPDRSDTPSIIIFLEPAVSVCLMFLPLCPFQFSRLEAYVVCSLPFPCLHTHWDVKSYWFYLGLTSGVTLLHIFSFASVLI